MQLHELVGTSQRVAATRARSEKIDYLVSALLCLEAEEIEIGIAFLAGELRQGRIGIGYASLRDSISESAALRGTLTLTDVDCVFDEVSKTKGAGSTAERLRRLRQLFLKATREEQGFLFRLLLGELRQGALEGVLVEAVAKAAGVPAAAFRRCLMFAGNLGAAAHAVLTEGERGLGRFTIQPLQPVQPMLAQPADAVSDALARLATGAFEFKIDGVRLQVHRSAEEVRVFTRKLKDVTPAVPEIVDCVRRSALSNVILDGEVLALRGDRRPYPFQTTMRRFGRKLKVEAMRESLPLTVFFFDCLYADGESLIDRPGEERFQLMAEALPSELVMPRIVTSDPKEAEEFLSEALERGHEGVMAKSLEASYEAGRRGSSWLKVKPSYSLDLVVLAAEWGHGRRHEWLSNLHLGARDPSTGGFTMIGKTFKGMTDKMLAWQTERLQELRTAADGHTLYVRPELVVEVAFNEIQASPHYPAGMALRFARVKRYRPDKQAQDADTVDTVRAIHEKQVGRC